MSEKGRWEAREGKKIERRSFKSVWRVNNGSTWIDFDLFMGQLLALLTPPVA
jgi:hypothetical protein